VTGLFKIPENVKTSYFIGALGWVGMSASCPIKHIAEPKKDEVALVSGSAGAVGSVAA